MAICEISNGKLTASVNTVGAELKSLRRSDTDQEYMWRGDAAYWDRTSPILFPLVGGLKNGEYRTNGNTYTMNKHGFARDMEFRMMSQEAAELWFSVESNEETKKNFPYDFKLEIGYRLEEYRLKVMWRVENPAKEQLYFSIGGHPGFCCPLRKGESRSDYFMGFGGLDAINSTVIGKSGLATENKVIFELENGMLPVDSDLFAKDSIVLEDRQTQTISLYTPDKQPYVTVNFDAPVVLVWTQADPKAEFVCIEPWCGLCDFEQFDGDWKERKWGNELKPGKWFASEYEIIIQK